MKKLLSMLLILTMLFAFSISASAFSYDYFDDINFAYLNGEYDANIPLIEFTEEYFVDQDVESKISALLKGVAQTDIDIKHYSQTDQYGTTYYADANALDGSFVLKRSSKYYYGNDEDKYPSLYADEVITVSKEAFEYLPESFGEYIKAVETLEKALETYSHFSHSTDYFEENDFAMLCPRENNYFCNDENTPLILKAPDYWYPACIPDTSMPAYTVYMYEPYVINIAYTQNTSYVMGDSDYNGISGTWIKLYYSQNENLSESKLTKIVFDMEYGIADYPAAPQTSLTAVAYVTVAIAALGVVVVKKRK